MKRLIAVCLMAVLFSTGSVMAAYSGGTGESNNPYIIRTVADWQELMAATGDWNKNFRLTADIDLAGVSLMPVGKDNTRFTGVFDGDSHAIWNAVINMPSRDYVGLFGYVGSGGQIKNLGVENVNITGSYSVGGLIGANTGSVTSCYATGSVTGTRGDVGGLVGVNWYTGSVTSCYATDSVTGTEEVGGLVGYNQGNVTACYATGYVTGDYSGGLVGYNDEGHVISSFWDMDTSDWSTSDAGRGLTTAQMKTLATFYKAGWGAYGWVMADGVDYPRLSWENTGYPIIPAPSPIPLAGSGTETDPYQIRTPADFALLSWYSGVLDKHILLMNDIDVANEILYPVGDRNVGPFTGSFDGNGHVIHHAVVNVPSGFYVGLFGYVGSGGQIKNLGVEDVNITSMTDVGGLIGTNGGSVTFCYVTGSVRGARSVGGLVGGNLGGSVASCYATASVSGTDNSAGGLVGENVVGSVSACYATGSVTGGYLVGGLVGVDEGVTSGITVVGANEDCSVTSSFWNIETSGQGRSSSGKGLTTAQMKTLAIFSEAGWGAYGWVMADGEDYPRLNWEGTGYPAIPEVPVPLMGSGTKADPYQVRTPADFAALSWYPAILDKYIVLMNDVDVSGETLYPIGGLGSFTGIFDGNGHVIHNAVIRLPLCDNVGLFGYVGSGGQIKNLGVVDANITGGSQVGGLAGWCYDSNFTSCYVTGAVSGDLAVGGLIGENYNGNITSCYAKGSINGRGLVGGLVGQNALGSVTFCHATSSVSGYSESSGIGGLLGGNYSCNVTSCYATGSVSGVGGVGGLVGSNNNFGPITSTITSCYATGLVSGTDSEVGGLIGDNYSSVVSCYATGSVSGGNRVGGLVGYNYGSVTSSYSTGSVSGTGSAVGGFVGENWGGPVVFSFWDTQTSGQPTSAGGTGKTTAEMKTLSTFRDVGWGAYDWVMADSIDYPRLNWESTGYPAIPGIVVPLPGSGTEADPYQVWTPADFAMLNSNIGILDKHIILMSDIDVTSKILFPIGDGYSPFVGVFDGHGHVIRNAAIRLPSWGAVGLFGYVGPGGQIKNLGVVDVNITGGWIVGGLCGFNEGSITACYSAGSVNGDATVGGLVGDNQGSITSCYATGLVSVSGTEYDSDVGGLMGYNIGSVTSSYATGSVTGTGRWVGGLVGSGGSVTASFWDTETSGQDTSAGGTGLTTAEMMTQATFTDAGWDFVTVWKMLRPGEDYPRLAWQEIFEGDIAGLYGVDMYDLAEIATHWLQTGCPTGCENGDIDGSGTVDFNDYALLAQNWLGGVNP